MTDAPTEVDIPVQVDQGSIYYDDIIDLDETESKEAELHDYINGDLKDYKKVAFKPYREEQRHSRYLEKFYIGRGIVNKTATRTFNKLDHNTWDLTYLKALWEERKKDANGGYHIMVMFAIGTGNGPTKCLQKKLLEVYSHEPCLKMENEINVTMMSSEDTYFVLYTCFQFKRCRAHRYHFELCDLGNDTTVRAATDKLLKHIDSLLLKYSTIVQDGKRYKSISQIHIGKTLISGGQGATHIERMNAETWETKGISSRWGKSYKDEYKVMIVLAAITEDTLPRAAQEAHGLEFSRRRRYLTEQYALSLEGSLITHYLFDQPDPRLDNKGTATGKQSDTAEGDHKHFVVYMCLNYTS